MPLSNSQTIAKNTGFLFLRMIIVVLVGLYTSRVVLNTLGIKDYGIYNIVGTLVVMFYFFKSALTNATSRFITFDLGRNEGSELRKTFSMSINVHVLLAILIILLSELVGPWFIQNHLNIENTRRFAAKIVFQFSLLAFIIDIIKTPFNSLIIAHEKMNFYALTSIAEVILKLAIVYLLLVISFDKLILYSILIVGVNIILFLWMMIYCRKHFFESKYKYIWDKSLLKKLVNYSGLSLIVNIADVTVAQSISIFFNIFYGVTANAAYGIASQVNTQLNNFVNNFSQSYSPQIIKSYAAGKKDYFLHLIYSSSKISFYLLFGISFPILLNINYILKIWLINPPSLSASFLYCIIIFSLFDALGQPMWTSVHATGKLKVHQTMMFIIKITNIPLSYILLKFGYPIITVLIIYASLNAVCFITRTIYLTHLINLDLKFYFKDVILHIIIVIIISVLPVYLSSTIIGNNFHKLLFSTLIFLTLYSISIYFFGINNSERNIAKALLKNFINKIRHLS